MGRGRGGPPGFGASGIGTGRTPSRWRRTDGELEGAAKAFGGATAHGLGLFHVISSYCGQFVISATSCRVMMPDPAFYRQCLQESFEELLAAASKAQSVKKPKSKKAARPRTKKAA